MEGGTTDLTEYLAFGAVIPVEEWHGGITAGTGAFFGDIASRTPDDRLNHFIVTEPIVFQEPLVFNGSVINNLGKDIGFELLVFRGVGVIKSPLLQGNIFSDKKY